MPTSSPLFAWVLACAMACGGDGGDASGREPAPPLACEERGFPCSPSEEPDGVSERAETLRGRAAELRRQGESFESVAQVLEGESDVEEVHASPSALVFRITGGRPRWIYGPGTDAVEIDPAVFTSTVGSSGGSLVVRPDDAESQADQKNALIVDPFAWEFTSVVDRWAPRIRTYRDWQGVEVVRDLDVRDDNVTDAHFTDWSEYELVWILTHGERLPRNNPQYSVLFNSTPCGLTAWAEESPMTPLDNDPAAVRGNLAGLDKTKAEQVLSAEEIASLDQFIADEKARLNRVGKTCEMLEHDSKSGTDPFFIYWQAYDKDWFNRNMPRLDNVLIYQSACSSDALPLRLDGDTSARFGWSRTVNSADDNRTVDSLLEALFEDGLTVTDAESELIRTGLHASEASGERALLSYEGADELRVRESIHFVDPDSGNRVEGSATFESGEITPDGATKVDFDFEIIGIGDQPVRLFELFVELPGRGEVVRGLPVDRPDLDGVSRMTVEATLPFDVRSAPGPHRIRAKVELPDRGRGGEAFGIHEIEASFVEGSPSSWSVQGGATAASGEKISLPFPRGIPDDDGNLIWTLMLNQSGDTPFPTAQAVIFDHEGRNADCTGRTGTFDLGLSVVPSGGIQAGAVASFPDDPSGECNGASIEITSFNRDDGFVATLSGSGCRAEPDGMGGFEQVPVSISGRIDWARAGCGAPRPDPEEGFVGSYSEADAPYLCSDIYRNAQFAQNWDVLCESVLTCSDDPCDPAGQIGECDYRAEGAQAIFRGQILHFYPGIDADAADLALGCRAQGGTWSAG